MDQEPAAENTVTSPQAVDEALSALLFSWEEAYRIGHDDEHGWWAARRDQIGGLITAADPGALRTAIIENYMLKPVPRDLPAIGAEE